MLSDESIGRHSFVHFHLEYFEHIVRFDFQLRAEIFLNIESVALVKIRKILIQRMACDVIFFAQERSYSANLQYTRACIFSYQHEYGSYSGFYIDLMPQSHYTRPKSCLHLL